jgi:hypothetical protein
MLEALLLTRNNPCRKGRRHAQASRGWRCVHGRSAAHQTACASNTQVPNSSCMPPSSSNSHHQLHSSP